MKLSQRVRDCIRKIKQEDILVFLHLVQQLPCNYVRDPVVTKIVLCNTFIVLDNGDHFLFDLFFNCISNVFLITENVHLNISDVQLFQFFSAIIHCSQHFICSLVFQRISHEFECPQLAFDVSKNLLDIFHSILSNSTKIEGKFLYFIVLPQSDRQICKSFISNIIVIKFEFDDIVLIVSKCLSQEFTPQCSDLIIHQVQIFNSFQLINIIADAPQSLILQINLPQANHLQMLVVQVTQSIHKGTHLDRSNLFPKLQLRQMESYALEFSIFDGIIQPFSDRFLRNQSVELALSLVDVGKAESRLVFFGLWCLLFLCHGIIIYRTLTISFDIQAIVFGLFVNKTKERAAWSKLPFWPFVWLVFQINLYLFQAKQEALKQGAMNIFKHPDTKLEEKQTLQKVQVTQTGNDQPCQLIISDYESEYSQSLNWHLPKTHKKSLKNKLHRVLVRPKDIKINGSHIKGGYGHSSAIFKRPILQGIFFIQVRILPDLQVKYKPTLYPSSVRVGICPVQYKNTQPLGCKFNSIAYKSNGCFVNNKEIIANGQPYGVGDVISIVMNMGPAYKNPNPHNKRLDSSVLFYKNGSLVFEFADLKQIFYCFGISLYNYSQVEFLQDQHTRFWIPEGSKHYYNCLQQNIPYQDLASNKIFKIHK